METGCSLSRGMSRSSAASVRFRPCSRVSVSMTRQYNKATKAESGRGGNEKRKKGRPKASLWHRIELGGGASRQLHAAQNRSQDACHVVGRADIAGPGLEGRHPHFLIRDAVGADNRQLRKIMVETFDIREQP